MKNINFIIIIYNYDNLFLIIYEFTYSFVHEQITYITKDDN